MLRSRVAAAAVRDEMLAEMNLPTARTVDPLLVGEAGAVAVETTPATVDLLVVAGVAGDPSGHDNKTPEHAHRRSDAHAPTGVFGTQTEKNPGTTAMVRG